MPKKKLGLPSCMHSFLAGLHNPGLPSHNVHFFRLNTTVSLWRGSLFKKKTNTRQPHMGKPYKSWKRCVVHTIAKLSWKHVKQLVLEGYVRLVGNLMKS